MNRPPGAAPGPGRAEIVAILASFGDRPPEEVPEDIDSMELAWLVHQIEQRYGAGVDDATMARMTTVSAVLAELAALRPAPSVQDPPPGAPGSASAAGTGEPAPEAHALGPAAGEPARVVRVVGAGAPGQGSGAGAGEPSPGAGAKGSTADEPASQVGALGPNAPGPGWGAGTGEPALGVHVSGAGGGETVPGGEGRGASGASASGAPGPGAGGAGG